MKFSLNRGQCFGVILISVALFEMSPSFAQRGQQRERPAGSDRPSIQEAGLMPVFPQGNNCPPITSAFGARTDGAGNMRDIRIHGGRHGGVDIGLKVGHPLVAIMSGEVIAKGPYEGRGAQMEGIFLWLRHSPQDSNLPFWTFSKYQHLDTLPTLNVGDRVVVGQPIGLGGDTGTYAKKFGISLPHLHMSTFINEEGRYKVIGESNNMVVSPGALHIDMMALFIPGITIEKARSDPFYSESSKSLFVATADIQGALSDSNAKIVWPVACLR